MILVINAGSSSLKSALYTPDLTPLAALQVADLGGSATLRQGDRRTPVAAPDHASALRVILTALAEQGHSLDHLTAAAHRVVHGGARLVAPVRIDAGTLELIREATALAPLHNPAAVAGIAALADMMPGLPQTASFDTAFHATNPPVATTYALPKVERDRGLRRYGFHGLSYAHLVGQISPLPRRLLAFHLGQGASLCAILDGRSVASSMGYSPLDGLVMGTRSGSIDGMAVLALARAHGIDAAEHLLNRESGLIGLAGTNDMRTLLAREDAAARFAVAHFCYWAVRQAGSALAAMGGMDAIAFTGGIGENAAPVRDRIVADLAWAGTVPIHVIKTDEERQIARDCLTLLS
jgi:acetate kinase